MGNKYSYFKESIKRKLEFLKSSFANVVEETEYQTNMESGYMIKEKFLNKLNLKDKERESCIQNYEHCN